MRQSPESEIDVLRALVALALAKTATGISAVNFSAGTTSNNLSAVIFSNSNGVSFGLNGSTITASVLPSSINISAGTTSNNLTAVTFSNANGVSFGLNGSVVTASAAVGSTAPGGIAAGTQTATSGTVVFSNSNGVTFGMSGSSRITASFSVATSLTAINLSAGTTSNNLSAIVFSNSNNVSFGLNGSTVTATAASAAPLSVSVFSQDADFVTNFSAAPGGMSLQKLSFPMNLSATQLIALLDLEGASNSSGAMTLSHAVYTLSASTASLASSASRVFSWTSGSAVSASSQFGGVSGTRYRTVGVNYSLTPGDYLFAWQIQTANNGTWNVIGRAGVNIVGPYDGVETTLWLNGSSVSTVAAFPASIVATDTGYVRTGVPALRQPGAILVGTGA